MGPAMTLPLSVLDLAPVASGTTASAAVRRTVDLARLADRLGFVRYWFAEHHGMRSVASSSPEVLIGHAAGATRRIRVGSGGVMLPNHAPLRITEAFHTLEALYPGIDLGIGRAPGSDLNASRALRAMEGERLPALLSELLAFSHRRFSERHPYAGVCAMPDDVRLPPIWILASSGASAAMAGGAGMGYSFAAHFSPAPPAPAIRMYRENFEPSANFPAPHVILGVAAICADTEAEAQRLGSSMNLLRLWIGRGEFPPLPSPEEALSYPYTPDERAALEQFRALSITGTPAMVRERIEAMAAECSADEVMVVTNVHDAAARLRSYELLAAEFGMREPAAAAVN